MLYKLAFRNLSRQKSRTIAILATVALGVTALMIYHGFNTGITNQYRENTVHARYGHGQVNTKGFRDKHWEKPWEQWMPADHPVIADLKAMPEVGHVFPRVSFYGLLNRGGQTLSGYGEGVVGPEEAGFFTTINIIAGETLSLEDDGIILGKGLAENLNAKIGDTVTVLTNTVDGSLNGLDFRLVGIFFTGMKSFDDVLFRVQLPMAHSLLGTDKVENLALGLSTHEDWDKVEAMVRAKHPDLEAVPFNVLDKVFYQNSVDFLEAQFGFILLVIFAIVILGIFNTVSTVVMERKSEIGNLRANGESKNDILKLLVVEGIYLGVAGALMGLVLAWVLNATALSNGIQMPPGPGITRQFTSFVELQWSFVPVCLGIGLFSTLLGTVLAGTRLLKQPIVQLLRSGQ
jgi:putative ABC transport system permease protein